jgi:hypothetical protein
MRRAELERQERRQRPHSIGSLGEITRKDRRNEGIAKPRRMRAR